MPPLPATQAAERLTADRPRNLERLPLSLSDHPGDRASCPARAAAPSGVRTAVRFGGSAVAAVEAVADMAGVAGELACGTADVPEYGAARVPACPSAAACAGTGALPSAAHTAAPQSVRAHTRLIVPTPSLAPVGRRNLAHYRPVVTSSRALGAKMRDMDQFSPAGEPGAGQNVAAGEGVTEAEGAAVSRAQGPLAGEAGFDFDIEFETRHAPAVTGAQQQSGTAQAWAALGGDPALLGRVSRHRRPGPLPSALPVLELAASTVAACSLAAAEFSCVRARSALLPAVRVDDGAVAAAFRSDRLVRIDGRDPVTFAPLSRFWRAADGWVRTHANYPHHRSRLLSALSQADSGPDSDEAAGERLAAVLAERPARDIEETVYAAGGLAVAVRTPEEWAAHPQREAAATTPLVATSRLDSARPLPLNGQPGPGGLQGLRVLDLTRVLAGPVATRTLALLGADVLRIDAPERPELLDTHADTDLGKRSTLLDLSTRAGQTTFEELLASAHVVVTGYRPGALDRFGLAPESLMDRRPGLVVGQLCAWGTVGPWQRRRGFDSLVQAASGIALIEAGTAKTRTGGDTPDEARNGNAGPDRAPGALPTQALDHGSGYLLAAGLLRALTEQRTGTAGSRLVRLALARTAHWLLEELPAEPGRTGDRSSASSLAASMGNSADGATGASAASGTSATSGAFDPAPWLTEADSPLGRLRYALPAVGFGPPDSAAPDAATSAAEASDTTRSPGDWARVTGIAGGDQAVWL